MPQALFEDYYRDTCSISKSNMIAFLEANALYCIKPSIADCSAKAYVFVGEKEHNAMRKSARIINDALSESTLQILPGMYHGAFSINHADNYACTVREIVKNG